MNSSEPRKIRISTALQIGCVTGLLTACAPAFLCSLSFNRLVHAVHRWILSWDGPDAELSIGALLGGTTLRVSLNMQDHLKMTRFAQTLGTLEGGWWWTIPMITLLLTLLVALGLAVMSGMTAGLYNELGRERWFMAAPERQPTRQLKTSSTPMSNEER
jgi:hypothetical protein